MTFDEAFERVIGHEGDLSDDPRDPGGLTRHGISQRAYPAEDIRAMTLERAKVLYRRDYWGRCQCDQLPAALRFHVFDAAVNSGTRQAVMWLQRTVGATPDGVVGAKTIAAAMSVDPRAAAAHYNGHRLQFMADLPAWGSFSRGWARRIASNLLET